MQKFNLKCFVLLLGLLLPAAWYGAYGTSSMDGHSHILIKEMYGKAMGLSVEVKPNPATTWVAINFTLPGNAKNATLILTNSLGVKVASYSLNEHEGQKVLDLRDFASGVYTCTVVCDEYYQTQKIVITQ